MDASESIEKLDDAEVRNLRDEIAELNARLAQFEADALYAEAMENSSEAIVIYDADGRLVACNRNFRELYGYTPEEARKGVHFAELGRIDVERGNVVIGDALGGGEAYLERKAAYRRKLEGAFIVQLSDGRWIKTVDRRMQRGGFVSVQVDITDMKNNEQALRTAMEEAEKAAHFKSEFLANISHDLRTPLNAILGFSEMILSECKGPLGNDDYKDYVEDINESGQLLLSIVNDILDTVKLESGKLVLNSEHFDAIACTESVVKKVRSITQKKNLTVRVDKNDHFPETICTDKRATIQILNNLISNAAKFSDDGAVISIEWRKTDEAHISVCVIDTGAGMSPATLEKIGDPFLQEGSYTVHSEEKGAGLGLYICTKLIAAMGGRMEIDSELGEGTSVTMIWSDDCAGPGFCP